MSLSLWPRGGIKKSGIYLLNPSKGINREVDLRKEMEDILEGTDSTPQRGHWILLRRMETAQRCTCWNERSAGENKFDEDNRVYDEPSEDCTICGGEGYVYDDELHLVRRRVVAPDIGLANQETESPVGIMNVQYIIYYFQYYVNPTKKDKIIEIENDNDGNPVRPFVNQEILNISVAVPFRDQLGRIEFWRCAVKQEVI